MANTQAGVVLRHIRGLVAARATIDVSDGQLLERFIRRREEPAFEALVKRHGPLVLGVCRRVLRNRDDAEDAFQAVFLVLARRAASISKRESIGSWLYKVAYHMAVRARKQAATRRKREDEAPSRPIADPLADVTGRELLTLLDEELQNLPERYRGPLIHCYLEGQTRDEAARQLGCSESTIHRRLEQGREQLRERLARRGLILPAGLMALALAQETASGAVAAKLRAATVSAALRGAVSAHVAAMADGALRAMNGVKLKIATSLLLATTLALAGGGALARQVLAQGSETPANTPDQPSQANSQKDELPAAQEGEQASVSGRVLDAKGKPIADVSVAIVATSRQQYRSGNRSTEDRQLLGEGKGDVNGRFQITIPRTSSARQWDVEAVANAKGHALGWQRLGLGSDKAHVIVTLPAEEVIRARLVDLQGLPAAGVKVAVSWMGKEINGESHGIGLASLPARLGLWPETVTTDRDGWFVLRGCNRGRSLWVHAKDDRFTAQSFEIRPLGQSRPASKVYGIDAGGYINVGEHGADEKGQPKQPTFTLAPSQVLEGRVVYDDTGKPAKANIDGVTTDADGKFRLALGVTKAVTVVAWPAPGEPYLPTHRRVEWPKGSVRQEVEIRLRRGMLVRGKVTEAGSGKPIAGAAVSYMMGDGAGIRPKDIVTGWQVRELTRDDGTFALAVPAALGHLLVQGPTPEYVHQEIDSEIVRTGRPGGGRLYPDAFVKLNLLDLGMDKEIAVTLKRGVTVRGHLVGPDGKPVAKAVMLHRLHVVHDYSWHFAQESRDGCFEIHGLDPEKSIPVFFLDAEHQCGAKVDISGKQAGQEVIVRLIPCGKATARYIDGAGKPVAGHSNSPDIVVTPGEWGSGARAKGVAIADSGSLTNLDRHNYWDKIKTDTSGRVTFPALIPGATYRLQRWEGDEWVPHKEFTVESGKTVDLGDVPIRKEQ